MSVNDLKYTVSVTDVYDEVITDSLLKELGVEVVDFRVPRDGELLLCLDLTPATRDGHWSTASPRLILRRVPKYEYVTDGVERLPKKGEWYKYGKTWLMASDDHTEENSLPTLCFTRREVK